MSKSNAHENDYLLLMYNNTNIANLGDATGVRGSTGAGNLFVALHIADPGEAGDQSTNEISYTGYARVSVARSSGGWTVSGNQVTNVAAIVFGQMTAGTGGTATHWSIGYQSSGATKILHKGALSPTIAVANGVTPQITTLTITED